MPVGSQGFVDVRNDADFLDEWVLHGLGSHFAQWIADDGNEQVEHHDDLRNRGNNKDQSGKWSRLIEFRVAKHQVVREPDRIEEAVAFDKLAVRISVKGLGNAQTA